MSSRGANRAASIRARLLAKAKARGEDFNRVLTRFATERWLYRLSVSGHAREFLLKGAMLFDLWFDQPHRPTRDADFLGVGPADAGALARAVAEVCSIEADDGLRYDAASIRVAEIRENASYAGLRVALAALLGTARCPMQLDVGFGDAVTPGPEEATFPTLLEDLPAPRLRVYPRENVIAEKLEAAVTLDMANSRMKDLFDLRMQDPAGRRGKGHPRHVPASWHRHTHGDANRSHRRVRPRPGEAATVAVVSSPQPAGGCGAGRDRRRGPRFSR